MLSSCTSCGKDEAQKQKAEKKEEMSVRKRLGMKERTQSNCVNKFPWEQKTIFRARSSHVQPFALGIVAGLFFLDYSFQF